MRLIHGVLRVRSSCICSDPFDVRCLRRFSASCREMPEIYHHLNSIQDRNQWSAVAVTEKTSRTVKMQEFTLFISFVRPSTWCIGGDCSACFLHKVVLTRACSTSVPMATSPTLWPSWQATTFPKTSVMTTDTRTPQTRVQWERAVEPLVLSHSDTSSFDTGAIFNVLTSSTSSSSFSFCLITAADGCLENAPDTAEFSREFQKHQHLFDPEHDYPARSKWVSTEDDWNQSIPLIIDQSNGENSSDKLQLVFVHQQAITASAAQNDYPSMLLVNQWFEELRF